MMYEVAYIDLRYDRLIEIVMPERVEGNHEMILNKGRIRLKQVNLELCVSILWVCNPTVLQSVILKAYKPAI